MSSVSAQTLGSRYHVWRVGLNVLGGQSYQQSQCIMSMSPSGTYASGVKFGSFTQGFLLNTTGTPAFTAIPPLAGSNTYGTGQDVNDQGNVVGYQRWTSNGAVTVVGWYYNRVAATTTRLNTPFDANPSITATPVAITTGSTHAFGTVDSDGSAGPVAAVGGFWNLSSNTWTSISGVREILDASADGLTLLVVNSSGAGQIIRGTVIGTYPTTIVSFTGRIRTGKVSPNGRYIGAAETVANLSTPFVYDTQTTTRMNLPLLPADTQGGTVGAISDTARVLGTVNGSAAGTFATHWLTPSSAYEKISSILSSDGHVAADSAYSSWNIYNGSGAISSDGFTLAAFGNNPLTIEDTVLFKQQCSTITLNPSTLPSGVIGTSYSQTITSTGGVAPYTYNLTTGTLPSGLSLSSAGVISGTPSTANGTGTSITVQARDVYGCVATRIYSLQICPAIALSPSSLINGTVGSAYSQTITATGGASPYAFTLASGVLPGWATLSSSTGIISGTPNSVTTASFVIRATDANGCAATQSYSVTPVCPTVSVNPSTLLNG
ncbi:MAG: Ig domain-containing protein, partial [Verrucomicrobia bacterium]|nr:Ig domain-containing protein [Verrucomicrobiota bacterium]